MKIPVCTVVDFETEGIQRRPAYPPVPVGVSIKRPQDRVPKYYAWGHPTENNCTKSEAVRVLKDEWKRSSLLFQHAKFDTDVADVHLGLPVPSWERIHDTEYPLFLTEPYADTFSLKPSAERVLGIKPEERDELKEWILKNVPEAKRKPSEWGAYICKAPGKLTGRYANGDVTRTDKLFDHLYPKLVEQEMVVPYDRERHLMPILLETERVGIRCDVKRLRDDYNMYLQARENACRWLQKKLHAPDLNIDADAELANVLDREGVVTDWVWTKGGKNKAPQRSVAKDNMTLEKFNNRKIALVYGYIVRLGTCMSTFFEPWLAMAEASGGIIYTNWNQVRGDRGGDRVGARTGRMSSNPNFQNIPKNFEDKDDGYEHPAFLKFLPPLPLMRRYLLPDKGQLWGHRDFNQQELRMLAHFENGPLMEHYIRDPRFDIHTAVQQAILEITEIELSRGGTKIVNFADIYGRGLAQLAEKLRVAYKQAVEIRNAKNAFMPGVDALARSVKARGTSGSYIRTWGGRVYYCEPAKYVKKYKRVMDFAYKLLNYLIQGSSADVTKEAVIRYAEHPKREARFLLTVHDELNSSMPKKRLRQEMLLLRDVMASVEVDVPMISDGKTGLNWADIKKFED